MVRTRGSGNEIPATGEDNENESHESAAAEARALIEASFRYAASAAASHIAGQTTGDQTEIHPDLRSSFSELAEGQPQYSPSAPVASMSDAPATEPEAVAEHLPEHDHLAEPHQYQHQNQHQHLDGIQGHIAANGATANVMDSSTMVDVSPGAQGDSSIVTDGRRGPRRELSTSKRAAQNRAAQRAFRQRKEGYIKKLEEQVGQYAEMENQFKSLQGENFALREYVIHLQGKILDLKADLPPPPPGLNLSPVELTHNLSGASAAAAAASLLSSAASAAALQKQQEQAAAAVAAAAAASGYQAAFAAAQQAVAQHEAATANASVSASEANDAKNSAVLARMAQAVNAELGGHASASEIAAAAAAAAAAAESEHALQAEAAVAAANAAAAAMSGQEAEAGEDMDQTQDVDADAEHE